MLELWQRMPVIARAILVALVVSIAGLMPWATLSLANQKVLVTVPWAVVPASLYLWFFWRYLSGEGWPRSTANARRTSLRANSLSGEVWSMSLFAGVLGLIALIPFVGVLGRLVRLNEAKPIEVIPGMPVVTVFFLLVMASIVAGVVEEAAFRGYLQGPIERRHGPVFAILIMGVLFSLAHFTHHPQSLLPVVPYYLAVSAVYGSLAYVTNSILPSLVLHTGGDILVLNRLWLTGQGEWETSSKPPQLIWGGGADAAFWGNLTALLLLAGAAVWAFFTLAEVVRKERVGA